MLKDIVEVRPLEGSQLYLRFEDGAEGVVDVSQPLASRWGIRALARAAIF